MPSRPLAAAVCCAALLGAGCQGGGRRKAIAVIPKATAHLFWVSVEAGARAAGEKHNVEILFSGPSNESDFSRQIQIVDSMIARRVDGIAIAAAERKALVQAVDRAVAAGIPVVVFDSGLDGGNYSSFVATNNHEGGQLAARTLAGLLGGKGEVAVLLHNPGSHSSMERERGFDETIAREFPGVRLAARQFGMSDRAKARAAAENILAAHPNLAGMFASAEPSSLGAALAIKGRGLAGRLKYVAFDVSDSLVEDLRGGVIDALVVQDPFRMGFESVGLLVDAFQGKPVPKRVDLSARVIRKGDLDDPAVQALLQPDAKRYMKQHP